VATGFVLISLAVIAWICTLEEDKTVRRYIGIFANLIMGVGVLLLCTIKFTPNISKLGNSPYMLPMLVFILFACKPPLGIFEKEVANLIGYSPSLQSPSPTFSA
jgi:hypothetical protein